MAKTHAHRSARAKTRKTIAALALLACTALTLAACSSGSKSGGAAKVGPIKIWYSNNAAEVSWGKAMVAAWNKDHADQQVTGEEIPAGRSSEEVISAAVAAGSTPCLVFNGAPAAVSGWVKQGGLVPLNDFADGVSYIEGRSGAAAAGYKSSDGKYYQLPWKTNPVMIFYNKDLFKAAGLDPDHPALGTYADFLATAQKLTSSGAAKYAIAPAPTSEYFQNWFDFYPLYIAESGGKQLVENGKPTFDDAAGQSVADFWAALYSKGLAPPSRSTRTR